MAAPTRDIRNNEAKQLFDFGFSNFGVYTMQSGKTEPIIVKGGTKPFCELEYKDFSTVIEKEKLSEITQRVELPDELRSPVTMGEKVGRVVIEHGGEEIGSVDICAAENITSIGFGEILKRILTGFCLS